MTEQRIVVYAEFRDGYWYTSDDSPIDRQIVSQRFGDLWKAVEQRMQDAVVEVVPRLPDELVELRRLITVAEEEVERLKEELKEARGDVRLARFRYHAGFRAAGISAEDAGAILDMNPKTLANRWSIYRAETEGT